MLGHLHHVLECLSLSLGSIPDSSIQLVLDMGSRRGKLTYFHNPLFFLLTIALFQFFLSFQFYFILISFYILEISLSLYFLFFYTYDFVLCKIYAFCYSSFLQENFNSQYQTFHTNMHKHMQIHKCLRLVSANACMYGVNCCKILDYKR